MADVRERGMLNCGVTDPLAGFATQNSGGEWVGFDVAICRAVAAAVLGDSNSVTVIPAAQEDSRELLMNGEVDLLARSLTWTFSGDVGGKLTFTAVNYYDGQGFLVRKDLGVSSATELDGQAICVQQGSPKRANLAEYFASNNMSLQEVLVGSPAEAQQAYLDGECSVLSDDASRLAVLRASFEDPDAHIPMPEIISKEPFGPAVREGDDQWADLVRWTLFALIAAEEAGVTSANMEKMAEGADNPEVNRLLGTEGDLGAKFGLDPLWARRAIAVAGNYGEIFATNIGEGTPIALPRGLNTQWTQGGLIYAPPFR